MRTIMLKSGKVNRGHLGPVYMEGTELPWESQRFIRFLRKRMEALTC